MSFLASKAVLHDISGHAENKCSVRLFFISDSYFTPSSSEKDGVAIYAKDKLNSFERTDIKMQSIDFESVWIEIKNKNSKNSLWLSLSTCLL